METILEHETNNPETLYRLRFVFTNPETGEEEPRLMRIGTHPESAYKVAKYLLDNGHIKWVEVEACEAVEVKVTGVDRLEV